METLEQIQLAFEASRHRYIEHFLNYPKSAQKKPEELEAELRNLQQAFRWTFEEGNRALIPEFWEDVKDFLWDRGHWQIFVEWGEGTLKALDQLNDPDTQAWVLSELGWFWMEQGEFATAREIFDRAKRIFNAIGNDRGICASERYLGVLAFRMGNLEMASLQFKTALQIATDKGYVGMIAELKNLEGSLAQEQGNLRLARQFFEEARKEFEKARDGWRLATVLRNLAWLELAQEDLEAARDRFMAAIDLCERIDRKDMLYGCQLGLAKAEREAGNVERAKELAIAARTGFAKLGMKRDLKAANQFLSDLHE